MCIANTFRFRVVRVKFMRQRHPYLPTPPLGQDMTQGQFFKWNLTGLNSEFSFSETSCLTKAEELSLPYYLPIAGGRIIGFIPFPRVLVPCEMQSVSSRIWTRVAISISYYDNHYTTGTSITITPQAQTSIWKLLVLDRNTWFYHHHHQVMLLAQISLTLLPFIPIIHHFQQVFSRLHSTYIQSCCI